MELIPAILLGLGAFLMLPDRPAEAKWLTPEQRDWLTRQLEVEAVPLSVFVGSPISGALLHLDGMLNLRGWQWLFSST